MRRIVFLGLLLMLAGCGDYSTWSDLPFTTGSNPHFPAGDSENMRRVMGNTAITEPLTPEPGDVWPGPIKPPPTLQDLENGTGQPDQPLPPVGSSTPPPSNQPGLAPLPAMPPPATLSRQPTAQTPSPGQTYQTNQGPAVSTGGTSNYQTLSTPGSAGQSIVVPNGNGTSTIIHPNGTVETVPTPKP
jgi:hypothetical protein